MLDNEICDQLEQVVFDTFSAFAQCDFERVSSDEIIKHEEEMPIGGVVHIMGDFIGSVVFKCDHSVALKLAEGMFGTPEDDLKEEDLLDVLREAANIVGGNMKFSLGQKSILSTPKTLCQINSKTGVQEGERIALVGFSCDYGQFACSIYKSEIEIPN